MGFVMSDGMENPKTKGQTYKLSREIAKRFGEKNTTTVCGTLKASDRIRVRSAAAPVASTMRRDRLRCAKAARRVDGINIKRRPARLGSIQKHAGRRLQNSANSGAPTSISSRPAISSRILAQNGSCSPALNTK